MTGIREAIEAEWFNGNIAEDCRDRLLAALAATSDPADGLTEDEADEVAGAEARLRRHLFKTTGGLGLTDLDIVLAARTPADP